MLLTTLYTCVFLAVAYARIYNRCELADELRTLGIAKEHIATWVCIAFHESRLDTAAQNHGSGDHGLLQISELFWCGNGKVCGVPCTAFRDEDISDDVRCALQIHEEHTRLQGDGFLAWVVYPQHCRGNVKKYLAECNGEPKSVDKSHVFTRIYDRENETLRIDVPKPSYLKITSIVRNTYQNLNLNGVNEKEQYPWLHFKVKNIDSLKLPVFQKTQNPIPTLATPITTEKAFNSSSLKQLLTTPTPATTHKTFYSSSPIYYSQSLSTPTTTHKPFYSSSPKYYSQSVAFPTTTYKPFHSSSHKYYSQSLTNPTTISKPLYSSSSKYYSQSLATPTKTYKPLYSSSPKYYPKSLATPTTTYKPLYSSSPKYYSQSVAIPTTTYKPFYSSSPEYYSQSLATPTKIYKPLYSSSPKYYPKSLATPTTTYRPLYSSSPKYYSQSVAIPTTTHKPFYYSSPKYYSQSLATPTKTYKPFYSSSPKHYSRSLATPTTTYKPFYLSDLKYSTKQNYPTAIRYNSSFSKTSINVPTTYTNKFLLNNYTPRFPTQTTPKTTPRAAFSNRRSENMRSYPRSTTETNIFDLYLNTRRPTLSTYSFPPFTGARYKVNIIGTTPIPNSQRIEQQKYPWGAVRNHFRQETNVPK